MVLRQLKERSCEGEQRKNERRKPSSQLRCGRGSQTRPLREQEKMAMEVASSFVWQLEE